MWLPEDSDFLRVVVDGREVLSYMKCAECRALVLNNFEDRQRHKLFHARIDEARRPY